MARKSHSRVGTSKLFGVGPRCLRVGPFAEIRSSGGVGVDLRVDSRKPNEVENQIINSRLIFAARGVAVVNTICAQIVSVAAVNR